MTQTARAYLRQAAPLRSLLAALALFVASPAVAQPCNQNDARLDQPGINAGVSVHLPFVGNNNQPAPLQFIVTAENFKPLPAGTCPPNATWRWSDAEIKSSEGHKSLKLSLASGERVLGLTGTSDASVVVVARDETIDRITLTTTPTVSRAQQRLGRYALSTAIYKSDGSTRFDTRMQFVPSKNVVVFVLCPDVCSIGEVEQGRRFIEQEGGVPGLTPASAASNPPLSQPTAVIPPPSPPVSITAQQQPPEPKGAIPAPEAPKSSLAQKKGSAPPRPSDPVPAVTPTGSIVPQLYDPATGASAATPGTVVRAVWGDCTNRDVVAQVPLPGGAQAISVYGAKTDSLCIAVAPAPGGEERCYRLPRAVGESAIASLAANAGTPCPASLPWTVQLTRPDQTALDQTLFADLWPDNASLAGAALKREGDRLVASLSPEQLGKLAGQNPHTQATFGRAWKPTAVRFDAAQRAVRIAVEPNVVPLASLKFEFVAPDGANLRCEVELDIPEVSRHGRHWREIANPRITLSPVGGSFQPRGARGADLNRLYVSLGGGDDPVAALVIEHMTDTSRQACFIVNPGLGDAELKAGQIKRATGPRRPPPRN